MDRNLALEVVRVTEAAALAASRLMGRGDEKAADQAAVDAMRSALNSLAIEGTVVIGEGERDEAPIATVEGVFNAVVAEGDFVGTVMAEGRGAGAGPTASAVAADLVDLARGRALPPFALPAGQLRRRPARSLEARRGAYYLRLRVVDRPGVIADIAAAMRDETVSLEAMIQRARGDTVPVVLTTHETTEAAIDRVVRRLGSINSILEPPHVLPIELLA